MKVGLRVIEDFGSWQAIGILPGATETTCPGEGPNFDDKTPRQVSSTLPYMIPVGKSKFGPYKTGRPSGHVLGQFLRWATAAPTGLKPDRRETQEFQTLAVARRDIKSLSAILS